MKLSFINKMILVMGMTLSFACSAAAASELGDREETGEMKSRRVPSIARVCDRLRVNESQGHERRVTTRAGSVGIGR